MYIIYQNLLRVVALIGQNDPLLVGVVHWSPT